MVSRNFTSCCGKLPRACQEEAVAYCESRCRICTADLPGSWRAGRQPKPRKVTLVSHTTASANTQANGFSFSPIFSGDGKYLAFVTSSSQIIPGFNSAGPNFFNRAIVVEDLSTGKFTIATQNLDKTFFNSNITSTPDISDNGRYVVFSSETFNKDFSINAMEVYRKDMLNGDLVIVTKAGGPNTEDSFNPSISGDGNLVVFESYATDLGFNIAGKEEVFVKNMTTGVISIVSSTSGGVAADAKDSGFPSITPDGHYVVFVSHATNLDPTNGKIHVYRKDLISGELKLVSAADDGTAANGNTLAPPSISADGRYVLFQSDATNMGTVTGTAIFLKDLDTGDVTIVSGDDGVDMAANSTKAYFDAHGTKAIFVNGDNLFAIDLDIESGKVVWAKGVSGDFSKGANWNPKHVPGSTDDAAITPAGTYTVASTKDQHVNSLVTAKGATLSITGGEFEIHDGTGTGGGDNAGTISLTGGHLHLGGEVKNIGSIKVDGAKAATSIILEDDLTLTGKGTITIGSKFANSIVSDGTLTNVDNFLLGAGTIGDSHITLINQTDGRIDANTNVKSLTIDTGTHAIQNFGILSVSGSENLILKSDLDNSGKIVAFEGSIELIGTVNNSGTINLSATSAMLLNGDVTLQGGGTVAFDDSSKNGIFANSGDVTLTNVDNQILGFGQISDIHLTIINQADGVFKADYNTNRSVIDLDAHTFTNAGTIESTGLGGLTIGSALINTGQLLAEHGTVVVRPTSPATASSGSTTKRRSSSTANTTARSRSGPAARARSGSISRPPSPAISWGSTSATPSSSAATGSRPRSGRHPWRTPRSTATNWSSR
jgi:Tol biopolymer transport system component